MRLRKGYYVKVRVGHEQREGIVTAFHFKNGCRTISYVTFEDVPYWCYREQIEHFSKNKEGDNIE